MWRGHELFVSSLPLLVEYIPATLFYFLTPTVISLVLGALICRVRVGKKNPLYWLVSLFVSFFTCHASSAGRRHGRERSQPGTLPSVKTGNTGSRF